MAAIGTFVHDIGSREIRIRFDVSVVGAESPSSYVLAAAPGVHVPTIAAVHYYDADLTSVRLVLDTALCHGQTYSCQVLGLYSSGGNPVTTAPFSFSATDVDCPRVLGAYQSLRGCIDIVCDRPVGLTSVAAAAALDGAGPSTTMTLVPWTSAIPENTVRFSYASAPGAGYSITFSDIVDVSGNACASGTIDLTLAYKPSVYADLVQAQSIRTFVADVSNATRFSTAVLRMFFNCPMLNSDIVNAANWTIYQSGPHIDADGDATHQITAPDAVDSPTFIALVNNSKAMLNAHLMSPAHIVTDLDDVILTPDAGDDLAAWHLLYDDGGVRDAYMKHYERIDMHLYADHLHIPDLTLGWPSDVANDLKAKFNAHILPFFPTTLSSAYSPIGSIVNFASSSNAPPVTDQYTWFADLHVLSDAAEANFLVNYSGLKSEDSASTASGTAWFLSSIRPPAVMSIPRFLRGAVVRADCGMEISDMDSVALRDYRSGASLKATASSSSSLPILWWAFNNVLQAYKVHISNPLIPPYLGARHVVPTPPSPPGPVVVYGDYATVMDLSVLIAKANAFKAKLGAHTTSDVYHHGRDVDIDTPDAFDAKSLESLVIDLRLHLTRHNSYGAQAFGGVIPIAPFYHIHPGAGIISASIRDLVVFDMDGAVDGSIVSFSVPMSKMWIDNHPNVVDRTVLGAVSGSFEAVDTFPVLTSAVARPGLSPANPAMLMSDAVELYMSKPMRSDDITPGVNVTIVGAPITPLNASWLNDRVASVRVTNMSASPYSVSAIGLYDIAGNLIG